MYSNINIIDSFDILKYKFNNANLSVLKKRHMFFIWKNYYTNKYPLFSEYYIEFHRFLLDFDDYEYFVEQNIKKTYETLVEKNKIEIINDYVNILCGYNDDIILIYLEDVEKVQRCKFFRFVCYKN